jgi:hypothetical protein
MEDGQLRGDGVDLKTMGNENDLNSVPDNGLGGYNNQLSRLSPTPRKSERERKNISYDKLNKGAADSDEEISALERQQCINFREKKISTSSFTDPRKGNDEAVGKIERLIETLSNHPNAYLFNPLTDRTHPAFEAFAKCQSLLYIIDQRVKLGEFYQTTS